MSLFQSCLFFVISQLWLLVAIVVGAYATNGHPFLGMTSVLGGAFLLAINGGCLIERSGIYRETDEI